MLTFIRFPASKAVQLRTELVIGCGFAKVIVVFSQIIAKVALFATEASRHTGRYCYSAVGSARIFGFKTHYSPFGIETAAVLEPVFAPYITAPIGPPVLAAIIIFT